MADVPPGGDPQDAGDVVLLVDDTPDTLAMLMDALHQAGFKALVATGGAAALAICGRVTPDVILMDAMMPGLDGFETCRRLKASEAVAHVPVIFMTALSETDHVVQGFAAGGVDYVTKPVILDEMFARIRVHVGNARAARSARVALDTTGRYLLAVDRTGALAWATPQAGRLLQAAFPSPEGVSPDGVSPDVAATLPPSIAPALLAAIAGHTSSPLALPAIGTGQASLQLGFLGATGPNEFLFRLSVGHEGGEGEALRRRFALTAREAEVLTWIARGKSNRDIADILALSHRTVNKHLEGIFTKLGVENRASAAVLASRAIEAG